ncbi:MAG: acyltransferase family protein [Alistipes senegalensis]|nr:acyltransferase family protein [Alistipes senegalensis]
MEMSLNKESYGSRMVELDLLKLVAIFFVLWGHVLLLPSDHPYETNPIYLWICSFHMPLFMCLSGFFASNIFDKSFGNLFKQRFSQLLLPFFAWVFLIYGIKTVFILILRGENYPDLGSDLLYSIWFLKSAFVCAMLGYLGFSHKRNKIGWILFSLACSQLVIYWDVFIMYPCFVFGILIRRYFFRILEHWKIILCFVGTVFLVASIYISVCNQSVWMFNQNIKKMLINDALDRSKFCNLMGGGF